MAAFILMVLSVVSPAAYAADTAALLEDTLVAEMELAIKIREISDEAWAAARKRTGEAVEKTSLQRKLTEAKAASDERAGAIKEEVDEIVDKFARRIYQEELRKRLDRLRSGLTEAALKEIRRAYRPKRN